MNILKYPIASAERLEEAGKAILGGSPVFEVTNEDLYIKEVGTGKMIPIGGHCKQNKLTAGDNIEILTEKEGDESVAERNPEIRLKDDIVVKTVTVNPDEGNLPNWKATVKLGELTNGNAVFLITKATEVKDEVQGIIGGELVIKMASESGDVYYAEYEFTITSTGSWSLWGGSEAGTNARVCKVKYNEEWYYGIKIPAGDFTNIKKTDNPTIEEKTAKERAYLQMGTVDDDNKFYIGTLGSTGVPLSLQEGETTDEDGIKTGTYTVPVKDLVDNLGWDNLMTSELVQDNQWKEWYNSNTKLAFNIMHRGVEDSAWQILQSTNAIVLHRDSAGSSTDKANYSLRVYLDEANTQYRSLTLTEDGNYNKPWGDPQKSNLIDGETISVKYNHWYYLTVAQFQSLLGITFQGEWAQYAADTKYRIYFRIYTKYQKNGDGSYSSWTRLTCVQIRDMSDTTTITQRCKVAMGKTVVDFDAKELDPPFTWTSMLMNIKGETDEDGNAYQYSERYVDLLVATNNQIEIGSFNDRKVRDSVAPAEQVVITSVGLIDGTSDASYIIKFDNDYLEKNYNEVSAFTTNHTPIFQSAWTSAAATLYYEGQTNVDDEDTYSFFADFVNTYNLITKHNYTYETFEDNLKITNSEFWYNGWDIRDPSLIPEQPNDDSVLTYQVLSRESNDDDSFSEIFYFNSNSTMSAIVNRISNLQELGEDAPPYKLVLKDMILSLTDLQLLAKNIKLAERQIYLDMSECTVDSTAQNWSTSIFEGCSSLRGMIVPKGIVNISAAAWLWCTYMRELDLTPSVNTLTTLGASTGYNTSLGLLTSTRVRDFIVPRNVDQLNAYIVYSSNVKNMIYLHQDGDDPIKVVEWTFMGINNKGAETQDLGQDFHMFFETDYLDDLIYAYTGSKGSLLNIAYQMGAANNPTGNSGGWWTTQAVNSFVRFDKDWTQTEWQEFNNTYNWGEDLINQVRREFGATKDIEIVDYK